MSASNSVATGDLDRGRIKVNCSLVDTGQSQRRPSFEYLGIQLSNEKICLGKIVSYEL